MLGRLGPCTLPHGSQPPVEKRPSLGHDPILALQQPDEVFPTRSPFTVNPLPMCDMGTTLPAHRGPISSASSAVRSSVRCAARIGVNPAAGDASGQRGTARPATMYAWANADRNSIRCTSLTGVTPGAGTGSVQENRPKRAARRSASIPVRSSVKCTVLEGDPAYDGVVGHGHRGGDRNRERPCR